MSSIVLPYEDKPRYDKQLKLLVSIILALTLIPGLIFINIYIEIALTLLGVTAFDGLLFAAVIPRNYQIFRDRVRIKLGGPLAINIPLEDIKEAKHAGASEAFV